MKPALVDAAASRAFVEVLSLPPHRSGLLDGLTFTVKDNIDLAGTRTSFGSPAFRDAHPPAVRHALCVEQLLGAGAACVGKVVADEFTYSLEGENPFFGTPLNPRAPDRMPGGSSSGSASSVACGLADFSLGTDSGGSIRVPASFCGVWGMRPSLHRISEAGVLPFMPSVSTVGVVARSREVLERAMRILLRSGSRPAAPVARLVLVEDAWALADAPVRVAAEEAVQRLSGRAGLTLERLSFSRLVSRDLDLVACNERALRELQTAEVGSTVGEWIDRHFPRLGATFTLAWANVRRFDRIRALEALELCERLFEDLGRALAPGTLLCFPTTPTVAPLRGALASEAAVLDFYGRTMAVTSLSGVGRLPELTAPLLSVDGCPVGLSFVAGHYQDEQLLAAARALLKG